MKILVINGSPKKENSDTMHITQAFLDGMNEVSQNEVHIIHAIDRHIEYCTGCFACMRNGGNCLHQDDMRGILEEILESDLLIWSYPLYCYGRYIDVRCGGDCPNFYKDDEGNYHYYCEEYGGDCDKCPANC